MITAIEQRELTKLYKELESYANTMPTFAHIDTRDVFNDVIIKAIEEDKEIYMAELRKRMYAEFQLMTWGRKGALNQRTYYKYEKSFPCSGCQQQVPSGGFYYVRRKNTGQQEVLWYCIECHKKYVAEYCKERRKNADLMQSVLAANAKYRNSKKGKETQKKCINKWMSNPENKKKFSEYQKEWKRKKKEEAMQIKLNNSSDTP
jgi:hypothetical protein